MTPLLKICGITNLEDARFSTGAGADMLGFIFHPESPRYVDPKMAKDIVEWLYGAKYVGVFVDRDTEVIKEMVDLIGLEMAQLHGSESPWECSQLNVPVIKAIGVEEGAELESLREEIESFLPHVEYILLDTKVNGVSGGRGKVFDWRIAAELAEDYPIILAGGLNPSNIAEAIHTVKPIGVDLSSGLEERPGKKDLEKIEQLFENYPKVEA